MLDAGCCCTPQEEWIENAAKGKPSPFKESQPRVIGMLEEFDCTPPVIDVERARYFTESMRQTEGEHLTLRWGKALLHIAENIPVYIEDKQLIVGRLGRDNCRYGILYPELDGDFYETVLDDFSRRENPPIKVMKEDFDVILKDIGSYWNGKTYHHGLFTAMPDRCRHLSYSDREGLKPRYVVAESSSLRSSLQWVLDFDKVLKKGFRAIQDEAREHLASLDPNDPDNILNRIPFLQGVILACEGVITFAKRHAALAREKAAATKDPARKAELLDIAERCERVPEFPARTFAEAVQAHWFAQAFSRLEQRTGCIISNGRMDQQLISFYRQDMANGTLTEEKALEILGCLWCQMAQFIELPLSPGVMDTQAGFAHWEAVTIGGQTRDGRDATNRLSHLILQSKRELPLHYPDLAARVHGRSPEAFLWDVAETVKFGTGHPKLLNDEEIIPLLTAKGARMEEALDYAASGCTEVRMPNTDTLTSSCARINLAAALEMVFYRGRMLKYGEELLGVDTGDPAALKDWNAFFNAYISQIHHCLRIAFASQYVINKLREHCFAQPMGSSLHKLCMKHGLDLHSEHIPEGLELGFVDFIGFGTVIDSLSAIKMHIYEEKSITMTELVTALRENFSGHEALRALLQNSPRYGNNQEYADSLGKALEKAAMEYCDKHSAALEMPVDIRYVPVTAHVPFGRVVAASPNGRLAWTPLSDGTSPSPGADVNGPTGVLLSNAASKNYGSIRRAARMLNMKFSPQAVAGDRGTENLVQLFRTFVDLKLWHVQFNIINRETLLHAKAEPEKFKNLIVRVAGYSAYFVDLSPDMQDDIIARTEHETV